MRKRVLVQTWHVVEAVVEVEADTIRHVREAALVAGHAAHAGRISVITKNKTTILADGEEYRVRTPLRRTP